MLEKPWILGVTFGISASVALLVSSWLARILRIQRLVASPSERSSHTTPTPVGGGIGMLAGMVGAVVGATVLGGEAPSFRLLGAVIVLSAIGVWDDWSRRGAPWSVRLGIQVWLAAWVGIAAVSEKCLPVVLSGAMVGGVLPAVLAVSWIVGLVNVVNFMDGIDGIAASQVLISASAVALVTSGSTMVLAVSCAGACTGFLLVNWSPARIFMGDAGSAPLGFLLAAFAVAGGEDWGGEKEAWEAVLFVALTFGLFLIDATVTLLLRAVRGERIWEGHRQHLYQRMVRIGLSHGQVALLYASGGCILAIVAVAAWKLSLPVLGVVGIVAIGGGYAFAWCSVRGCESRRGQAVG